MFTVFSDLTDSGEREKNIGNEKTQTVDHGYSNSVGLVNIFDGTDLAPSTDDDMSQELESGLYLTEEELAVNLDSFLKSFASPQYTGTDPILGIEDLDLCNSDASLFASTSKEDSGMVKMEPLTPSSNLATLPMNENEVEVEVETSPVSMNSAPTGQISIQQQHQPEPKIAFSSNGLLTGAPAAVQPNFSGNLIRVVKWNPQPYQQQHQHQVQPSLPARSYSPSTTPVSSASGSHSRGAAYARQYRQKNREHMDQLEGENGRLIAENDKLRRAFEQTRSQNDKLSREVSYLREVLQNQSAIASILNAVSCNTPGLKFQFPISSGNKSQPESDQRRTIETRASSKRKIDDQYQSVSKKAKGNDEMDGPTTSNNSGGPGVCLHVNGETVSVEFCSHCNREARCVSEQWNHRREFTKSIQSLEDLLGLLCFIYKRIEM